MSRALTQFLQRGYFPKELPPAFTTYLFALNANDMKSHLEKGWNSVNAAPIKCSIPRNAIGRRYVHVVHPLPYFFLAKYLSENYSDIKIVCKQSAISYSSPVTSDGLNQRYITTRSRDVSSFQSVLQKKSLDKYVELKVDISNFYPSIYTHIIPWCFVGRDVAKKIWKSQTTKTRAPYSPAIHTLYHKASEIDELIQKCQEKQTHGIPVGPDSSFLVAEAILSYIDSIILGKVPAAVGCRYYDDYYLYFDTEAEAEQMLKIMIDEFKQFGLEVNLDKVEINRLPISFMDRYAIKLSRFDFSSKRKDQMLQIYFEIVWSLVRECPAKAHTILRYSMITLGRNLPSFSPQEENLLYILLFKTAVLAPAIIPELLGVVNKIHSSPDPVVLKRMTDAVLRRNLHLGHHVELLWGLWMCKRYQLEIDLDVIVGLLEMNHPLCTLMVLDYINNIRPDYKNKPKVKQELSSLKKTLSSDSLYDERWILIYEGTIKGWLTGKKSIIKADSFFSYLMKKGVSFYDTDPLADYSDATYILSKHIGVPLHIKETADEETKKMVEKIKGEVTSELNKVRGKDLALLIDGDFWGDDIFEDETSEEGIEEKVDELIEDANVKEKLYEEILLSIFSDDSINEEDLLAKYVSLLMKEKEY